MHGCSFLIREFAHRFPPLPPLSPSVGLSQWRRISSILFNDGNLIEDFRLCLLLDFRVLSVLYLYFQGTFLRPKESKKFHEKFFSQGFSHPLFSRAIEKFVPLWKYEGHLIETTWFETGPMILKYLFVSTRSTRARLLFIYY